MGKCNIDHSKEDVVQKYQSQEEFLPEDMKPLFQSYFEKNQSQESLNEVFHLLKKYDLADEQEKADRNESLYSYLKQS
ncbi:group-specific protein [Bacillus marinisedimentorum]|uniref:group-specific protein n=1 Tax=Bacillus marinisedimentorum TaxID=1821260 RepID=UPI0007E20DB0|nr:group-specific protein [Bacillus marinisedimentorum]